MVLYAYIKPCNFDFRDTKIYMILHFLYFRIFNKVKFFQLFVKTLPPYKPLIPFLKRLIKAKIEEHSKKFVEILKNLYNNIPFTKSLSQISSYTKFLKKILLNKKKLGDIKIVLLTKEFNSIIQENLPPKLKDYGSFSIPMCYRHNKLRESLM